MATKQTMQPLHLGGNPESENSMLYVAATLSAQMHGDGIIRYQKKYLHIITVVKYLIRLTMHAALENEY